VLGGGGGVWCGGGGTNLPTVLMVCSGLLRMLPEILSPFIEAAERADSFEDSVDLCRVYESLLFSS